MLREDRHLVPITLLEVGDKVYGYGHARSGVGVASYYPFDEMLIVRSKKNYGAGFTSVNLGPPENGSITTCLENETNHGDLAAVSHKTLKEIERRQPCDKCGRSG